MKLTFLGTGTSQGVPIISCNCDVCRSDDSRDKRLRSSVLIETNDLSLVIDCGPDFRQQMLLNEVSRLNAILLTHEHIDHIAGLDDIRAFNYIHGKPMDIYAEKRVLKSIMRIYNYVFFDEKYPGIPSMELHEIDNNPFRVGETEIIPIRAFHHKLPVFGYRINKIAYLTDINSIQDSEIEKLEGIEILVVNALRKKVHLSHFSLDEALALIDQVKPKQAFLTHVSHKMGMHSIEDEKLPKNIHFAYDGLSVNV